jgi:hypothetical protein
MSMTLDEAKAWIVEVQECESGTDKRQALDIALWLLEREHLVRKAIDAGNGTDRWNACVEAFHWETDHPRPGS